MTNIESVLHENRKFPPSAAFTAAARIKPADFAALTRGSRTGLRGLLGPAGAGGVALARALHADS